METWIIAMNTCLSRCFWPELVCHGVSSSKKEQCLRGIKFVNILAYTVDRIIIPGIVVIQPADGIVELAGVAFGGAQGTFEQVRAMKSRLCWWRCRDKLEFQLRSSFE